MLHNLLPHSSTTLARFNSNAKILFFMQIRPMFPSAMLNHLLTQWCYNLPMIVLILKLLPWFLLLTSREHNSIKVFLEPLVSCTESIRIQVLVLLFLPYNLWFLLVHISHDIPIKSAASFLKAKQPSTTKVFEFWVKIINFVETCLPSFIHAWQMFKI